MGRQTDAAQERSASQPTHTANTDGCRARACEEVGEAPDLGEPRAHQHDCLVELWERACAADACWNQALACSGADIRASALATALRYSTSRTKSRA